MKNDSIIVYKVKRQEERRVFYHGSAPIDASYFYCPYIPGMSEEERALIPRYTGPTEFQKELMQSIKDKPMVQWSGPSQEEEEAFVKMWGVDKIAP